MRAVLWLLAATLTVLLPSPALADAHGPSGSGQRPTMCSLRFDGDDAPAYHRMQCATGVALKVSAGGMRVRPAHGSTLQVRFTRTTLFATDSGEGVLDGLVTGDFVCVGYTTRSNATTALVVVFDPMWPPCAPRGTSRFQERGVIVWRGAGSPCGADGDSATTVLPFAYPDVLARYVRQHICDGWDRGSTFLSSQAARATFLPQK